jgi:PIN domain nuclease of toxin-antitoxin system
VTLLLDTHVLHWWSAEPQQLSAAARDAIREADELAVADITWFELAWLSQSNRIVVRMPINSWLSRLADDVRTVCTTPAIASTAVALPGSFPGDPADRLIYATAIENGWRLVTKDTRLRRHPHPRALALW